MEIKTFDYSFYLRVIRVSSVIMASGFMFLTGCAVIQSLLDAYTSYDLPENVTVVAPGWEMVGAIFFIFVFWNLVIINHLLFIAIRIRENEFQLYTPFYKSRWLTWDKIRDVKEHFMSSQRRKIITIGVDGVTPYFQVIGFTQLHGGSAFLVFYQLNGFKEFLQILNEKRPGLLSMELRHQIEAAGGL